ncbi:MAG: hypothetical protein Q8R12_04530 [bacterium]|nr:hypothetical protein [bacterium]
MGFKELFFTEAEVRSKVKKLVEVLEDLGAYQPVKGESGPVKLPKGTIGSITAALKVVICPKYYAAVIDGRTPDWKKVLGGVTKEQYKKSIRELTPPKEKEPPLGNKFP